jgi:ABC-type uncharacterized transport system involved in gliding motility auxiliary subunit
VRRLQDSLTPLGIAIAIGALAWQRSGRTLPGEPIWWLLAGLALIAVHAVLRWDDLAGAVGGRQLRHGGNALVLTVLVLGILGAVNFLAQRYNERLDLTENQRHSLSDQTRKVVSGMSEDVTITYFGRPEDLARGRVRLEQYEALSRRLKVVYLDPLADPVQARGYEARPPWPQIFVERGDKRERLTNDSEQDLTNALIKVFRDEQKVVCFVEGEGERDTDDRGDLGLSAAKAALETSQYAVRKLLLLREQKVPADCAVAVVAGPQNDLLPPSIDALRSFVAGGGSLLAMVEPPFEQAQPNLDGLLESWGLEAGKDVVIDVSGVGQLFGAGELTPIAIQYPYHEITKDFRVMSAFNTARRMAAAETSPEGVVTQNLVETSPQAWAETDLALTPPVEPQEGVDTMGPVSLGALATTPVTAPGADTEAADSEGQETPAADAAAADAEPGAAEAESTEAPAADPTPDPREGRVVAFGDVDFASNQFLGFQGNQDLFLNSVAWLAEDADLISIRPREPDDQRLFLTQLEQQNLTLLALLLIPGLFVVGGIATWWSRR